MSLTVNRQYHLPSAGSGETAHMSFALVDAGSSSSSSSSSRYRFEISSGSAYKSAGSVIVGRVLSTTANDMSSTLTADSGSVSFVSRVEFSTHRVFLPPAHRTRLLAL